MTKLTSKLVAAKVKGKAGNFADGNGLYLVVPKRGRALNRPDFYRQFIASEK